MKTLKKVTKAAAGIATCIAMSAASVPAADVGARMYIQGWNPMKPEDPMVTKPFEHTNMVSTAINLGWSAARATICDNIKDTLAKANTGSKGISFYQINCDMARSGDLNLIPAAIEYDNQKRKWITVQRMNSGRSFVLRLVLQGNNLDLHATTPSLNKDGTIAVWNSAGAVLGAAASNSLPGIIIGGLAGNIIGSLFDSEAGLGQWADPQFKINYDLVLDVGFNTTQGLNVNRVVATIANVKVSPANAPASVAKAAVDFANAVFKTPAFDALVAMGIEGRQVEFGQAVASGLNSLNNAAAPYANPVNQYVQLGVWGKNNMITLAFSPRLPAPMTPKVASVNGLIRMKKNANFSANICPSINLASQVMVGPRPIIDVEPLQFGTNPVDNFGRSQYTGSGSVTPDSFDCPYSLDQLPVGVLNFVWNNSTNSTGGLPGVGTSKKAAGTGLAGGTVLALRPAGWDTRVTPNPVLTGKNWDAEVVVNPMGSLARVQIKPNLNVGDPLRSKVLDQIAKPANPIARDVVTAPAQEAQNINPGASAPAANPAGTVQNSNPAISAIQRNPATAQVAASNTPSAQTLTTTASKSVIASAVQQRAAALR